MSRNASRYRSVGALAVVVILVAAYFYLELRPKGDPMPFAPGEWVNLRANSAVLFREDGTGEASRLSYIGEGDATTCTDDHKYWGYSGSLEWRWSDDGDSILFDLTDVDVTGLVVAPKSSGDWAEIAYWACGDRHQTRTYAMTRLELTDLWTPPVP